MEAKRYDTRLSSEALLAKAQRAILNPTGALDLWVLGATVPLADQVGTDLAEVLEGAGVTLLMLDWSARGVPRLAVLLALAEENCVGWWEQHGTGATVAVFRAWLDEVRRAPTYGGTAAALTAELHQPTLGFAAAQRATTTWLRNLHSRRAEAIRTMGQPLAVRDPAFPAIRREASLEAFAQAAREAHAAHIHARRTPLSLDVRAASSDGSSAEGRATLPRVVVVTGEEGVGKSWLVADWWSSLVSPPLTVHASGPRLDALALARTSNSLRTLAELLAAQDVDCNEQRVAQWQRRLSRWARLGRRGSGSDECAALPRLLIVLDGLNEHPVAAWGDLIARYAEVARDLGGLLVVTSRPHTWHAVLAETLTETTEALVVAVPEYTTLELDELLRLNGVDSTGWDNALRTFLRNPRLAYVAIKIASRGLLPTGPLSRERILFEYWRVYRAERSGRPVHSVADFDELLRRHARRALSEMDIRFPSSEWAGYSVVAQRDSRARARTDLSEITEGRFLSADPGRPGYYTFRAETLPFALGLLLTDDLQDLVNVRPSATALELTEQLRQILDPVEGVDQTADVIVAAIAVACLREQVGPIVRQVLVTAALALQNVDDEAVGRLGSYVIDRPDAFFDALQGTSEQIRFQRAYALVEVLRDAADSRPVALAREPRIARWLGGWSPLLSLRLGVIQDVERQAGRDAARNAAWDAFAASERAFVHTYTFEQQTPPGTPLARLAVRLQVGLPIAPQAHGILAWALVQWFAPEFPNAYDDVRWLLLLNPEDPAETTAALRDTIRICCPSGPSGASEMVRKSVAMLLRMCGDMHAASDAASWYTFESRHRWRSVSRFCATNPYDPGAPPSAELRDAYLAADGLPSLDVWTNFSVTTEDATLDDLLPALARFAPEVMRSTLRGIVATIPNRDWMGLRQLGWRLDWLSPLLEPSLADALRETTERLSLRDASLGEDVDLTEIELVRADYTSALTALVTPKEQLALLQSLPGDMPLYLLLGRHLMPLSATETEDALCVTAPGPLRWTLFFVARSRSPLTERARARVATLLISTDPDLSAGAAAVAATADELELDEIVFREAIRSGSHFKSELDDPRYARAVVCAVIRQRGSAARPTAIPYEALPFNVLAALAGDGDVAAVAVLDLLLNEIIENTLRGEPLMPHGIISFGASSRRHDQAGHLALLELPPLKFLNDYTFRNPELVLRFLRVLVARGTASDWYIGGSLCAALASASSRHDPALAARVLRQVTGRQTRFSVTINDVDPVVLALFSADVAEVEPVRRELWSNCKSDLEIEVLVQAAEAAGAEGHLDMLCTEWIRGAPATIARALTITGLRTHPERLDAQLASYWGGGVLEEIATVARRNAARYQWSRYWLGRAAATTDGVELFRLAFLGAGVADWRVLRDVRGGLATESDAFNSYRDVVDERVAKATKDRSAKRGKTLFGLPRPADDLHRAIGDYGRRQRSGTARAADELE